MSLDTPLPFVIRQWIGDRGWNRHHVQWHTERQWDRLSPAEVSEATALGWRRAARQEGEATNGFEFLLMHRAMLQLLREAFPADAQLFAGWTAPPTNPSDAADPVPAANDQVFRPEMADAITRLTTGLDSFADEDDLGLYIETRARPVPGSPFRLSPDKSAGIHNYLHNRFSDDASPFNMGDPEKNLGNARFWRLHGWIDKRWTAFRTAKGLSDQDPAYKRALDAERNHLAGHHGMLMSAAAALSSFRPVSRSIRSPFRESLSRRFQRAATETPDITTVEELQDYLQTAIMLEHATLPPYLTAWWSLDASKPGNKDIAKIIRGIAMQEMLHMGLASNLLKAVGGTPRINTPDAVPKWPDYLPGVDLGQEVDLRPLSLDRVKLFMKIEEPLAPIPPSVVAAANVPKFRTIGEFYDAIDRGLVTVNPAFNAAGQIELPFATGSVATVITSLSEARTAVQLIKEQGEGTPAGRGAVDFGGGLAHYYQFEQIAEQKKFVKQSPGNAYKLDPNAPLPFPPATDIYPMAPVPADGYPGVPAAETFDQVYSTMLGQLQAAWDQGSDTPLNDAVGTMLDLGEAAVTLMKMPRPDQQGNYGPAFRLVPLPPAPVPVASLTGAIRRPPRKEPDALRATVTAAAPAAALTAATIGYARVQQLLDEAVHGQTFGAHGPFWRTLTRDQFVAKSVFGKKLIAIRADGSFDPDESNLVKALEGRPPFGANLVPPPAGAILNRMPDGFDPMPQSRIDEIRAWIQAGCPDAPAVEPAWIDAAGTAVLPDQSILNYWREFDDWAMFNATDEVSAAIGVFFDKAPLWMASASDPAGEPAWAAAVQDASVGAAVSVLESRQRATVITHFGRPVSLGSLLNAYRRFGDNSLPSDTQRPVDPRHNMNGAVMWFMWSAFADAAVRLASPGGIPLAFWQGMRRAILLGLINDGLIRDRFTVNGFPATTAGQNAAEAFVRNLADADLASEFLRRFRESGFPAPG